MWRFFSWMCHCPYSLHPSITSSLLFVLFYCAVVGLEQSIFSEWESVTPPQHSNWPDIGEPIWSGCVIRRYLLWHDYACFVVRFYAFPPFSGRVFVAEGMAGRAGLSNKAPKSLVQQSTIKAWSTHTCARLSSMQSVTCHAVIFRTFCASTYLPVLLQRVFDCMLCITFLLCLWWLWSLSLCAVLQCTSLCSASAHSSLSPLICLPHFICNTSQPSATTTCSLCYFS